MQLIRALLLRRGFKFIFRTGIGGEGEAVFRSRNVKIPAFFFFFNEKGTRRYIVPIEQLTGFIVINFISFVRRGIHA